MKQPTRRLVKVEWVDSGAALYDGWEQPADMIERSKINDLMCMTVGFLLHEDEERVIVSLTWDSHHDAFVSGHNIFKPCIVRMVDLTEVAPARDWTQATGGLG